MKIITACLVVLTIAVSCSPVRRIDMKNSGTDTVEFIWTMNEDSLSNNPFMLSNSKELKFALYPPKRSRINMSFGQGNWSPSEVQKLVNKLVSLEIKSPSQNIKLDSLPLLKDYLLARRKGLDGSRIELTAQ
jgi:hypothetical protein